MHLFNTKLLLTCSNRSFRYDTHLLFNLLLCIVFWLLKLYFFFVAHEFLSVSFQRIQYAKTKSDVIAKADGTFVPRERRKRSDEKRKILVNALILPY
jgi:hypothetical protein